jgi:amino acid transporter
VAVVFNSIIGATVFLLPRDVFALANTYSLAAFIVCAGIVCLIVLCFAEVSSRFSDVGGPYQYAREAFGPVVGFEVAWLTWLTRVIGFAAVCNGFATILVRLITGSDAAAWRVPVILTLVGSLTLINFIGPRETAFVSSVLAIGKLTLFILFIVIGLGYVDKANFSFADPPSLSKFLEAVTLLVFAFGGFEGAVVVAGEVRAPRKNYPFALLVAILAVAVLYVLIQVVCIGTLPNLGDSKAPLADASAKFFVGKAGSILMSVGALGSMLGSLDAGLFGLTRLPFAIARQGYLPRIFAVTHKRFHTPYVSILFSAAIIIIFSLNHSFVFLAKLAALTRLITYAVTSIALIILRRRDGTSLGKPAVFKVPGGHLVALASVLLCGLLLGNSTLIEARNLGILTSLGLGIYFGFKSWKKVRIARST